MGNKPGVEANARTQNTGAKQSVNSHSTPQQQHQQSQHQNSASSVEKNQPVENGSIENDDSSENKMIFSAPGTNKKVCIDDFELLKVVGIGNFAKVMQVRKKGEEQIYAMKILKKSDLKRRDQLEHTRTERKILQRINHPFLTRLIYAFQSVDKLYMVMEFANGGELFFHLKRSKRFPEDRARFYAAEILLALEHLHKHEIVYRDLKAENVLLDKEGHIVLTDFGLSKELIKQERTNTFCGTPEYLAPEVLLNKGHGKPVDWWSFGTLLFEMLVGIPPFYSEHVQDMYEMILYSDLYIPDFVSVEAADLLTRLLERDPKKRLGTASVDDIKNHPFFKPLNWDAVYNKELPVPYHPKVQDANDTTNFEDEFTKQAAVDSVVESKLTLGDSVQKAFEGFTFVDEEAKELN